jgi:Mg2+-importing ATPase
MDSAVLVVAEENQLNVKSSKALAEVPYDFVRRRLSVAVPDLTGSGSLLITKGAFLDVLALCTSANVNGEIVELHQVREKLVADHQTQASQGNRVLLLASKKISSLDNLSEQEVELTAEGLLIFVDPIKPGAAESVEKMKELGIRVVVITGDNPLTTARVTKEVGLQSEPFFTGSQVEEMSEQQLVEAAKTAAFFASVNPMQKERIIKAMSESEESVGYFGDGINDSLALRAADVGISVENAVDVARESADIVLLAKDLDVLSEGVRIGRQTFANTMTYIRVTISASFGNVVSVVVAAAFLPFLPLLPMQILLLNFLSGFAHLAIATDRVDKEDLGAPKRWDLKSLRKFMLIFGFLSSAVDIFLYWLLVGVFDVSPEVFRSVWFIESLLSESVAMLVLRSKRPFWKSRPSTALLVFSVLSGVVAIAITYTPVIGTTLGFAPSPVYLLGAVAVLLLGYAVANEVVKRRFMV